MCMSMNEDGYVEAEARGPGICIEGTTRSVCPSLREWPPRELEALPTDRTKSVQVLHSNQKEQRHHPGKVVYEVRSRWRFQNPKRSQLYQIQP